MKKKLVFLLLLLSFMSLGFSQNITREDRDFVGNALVENSYDYLVQTVAMTRNCIVGIYGGNGFVSRKLPQSLLDKIHEYNNNAWNIYDIHIAENNEWVIVGDMVSWSENVPADCVYWIEELLSTEGVQCVSFNSRGDWCVIGPNSWACSPSVRPLLDEAKYSYGFIHYVHITNTTTVVTCENGYYSSVGWSVPIMQYVTSKLDEISWIPTILKVFYDGTYFMANQAIGAWEAWF